MGVQQRLDTHSSTAGKCRALMPTTHLSVSHVCNTIANKLLLINCDYLSLKLYTRVHTHTCVCTFLNFVFMNSESFLKTWAFLWHFSTILPGIIKKHRFYIKKIEVGPVNHSCNLKNHDDKESWWRSRKIVNLNQYWTSWWYYVSIITILLKINEIRKSVPVISSPLLTSEYFVFILNFKHFNSRTKRCSSI